MLYLVDADDVLVSIISRIITIITIIIIIIFFNNNIEQYTILALVIIIPTQVSVLTRTNRHALSPAKVTPVWKGFAALRAWYTSEIRGKSP